MNETNLIVPTVHLNGTSASDLLSGWEEAYSSLTDAYEALKRCAPNGRDYYVQQPINGRNPLDIATEQHRARLQKIDDIKAELEKLCGGVSSQEG